VRTTIKSLISRRELVRIGIENSSGAAVGDIGDLRASTELLSYPVADFADLAHILGRDDLVVVDVRQGAEYDAATYPGALNIPPYEVFDRGVFPVNESGWWTQ
jgi:hydroxyacylglutathione hydrolase